MLQDINISISRLLELKNKSNKKELIRDLKELQHVEFREQNSVDSVDFVDSVDYIDSEKVSSNKIKIKLTDEQKQFIHLVLPILIEKDISKLEEIMNIFNLKITDTFSYTTNGGYAVFRHYE